MTLNTKAASEFQAEGGLKCLRLIRAERRHERVFNRAFHILRNSALAAEASATH